MINKLMKISSAITAVVLSLVFSFSIVSAAEYLGPMPLQSKLSSDGNTLDNAIPAVVYRVDPNPPARQVNLPARVNMLALPENATASFSITYIASGSTDPWGATCNTFPESAKAAFNAAADIWANLLQSSVPITISACWSNLGSSSILGYSGGGSSYRNFSGAPLTNTWYSSALANALHGSAIDVSHVDMYITYNSNFTWYYGTDGATPAGQYDLMSVVLHEIAHGLNFSGLMAYSSGTGSWGSGTGNPKIYDTFMRDGSANPGNLLIDTGVYANPSTALGTALTSQNIWFHGGNAMAANGGNRVKIYAPSTWASGSSYSHLDYTTFAGTANRLMVYAISSGVSTHDPGPVTLGILKDMGWSVDESPDTTPNAFTFTDQTGVALSTVITSNTITVSGINTATPISISGGTYSINGGEYTSDPGWINNGNTVTVQLTSSGSYSTTTTATLTIGGVSGDFNVTTLSEFDTTPDQFTFTAQTCVGLNTVITSNTITVSGINAAAPISITDGTYSINGGEYTSDPGWINNGNTVTVQLTSSASYSTTTTATLTIGGVSDTFSVITSVDSTGICWTQKTDFGGTGRSSAVGFSIGSKGYMGTGESEFYSGSMTYVTFYKDFWEYDPVTNIWTQKADFGGTKRYGAVGFSIGSKGYIGTGSSHTQDFWEYDPVTNIWTQKADFGGIGRNSAVGFSIGCKGYIGTGAGSGARQKDFWEYNPATDTWTQKSDFGGTARMWAVGFSIGNKGYIGTGSTLNKDFWEYNPATDTWTQKSDFGGTARVMAVGFSIGSKGYIGTGLDSSNNKDFWEYDPAADTWTRRADFGGTARHAAVGFSIGSKGYIGTGYSSPTYYKDFWEYNSGEIPSDTTPDQFTFTDQIGVALNTLVTSNAITVSGIDAASLICITGGEYSVSMDGGLTWSAFSSTTPATVSLNDQVKVRVTSSPGYSTRTDATLTIGSVSDTFSVTTLAMDTTPDPFTFIDQTGVARGTVITSNIITVSGIIAAAPISIIGGKYSINGGDYTSDPGWINNGDTVTVQQTSSASYSMKTDATLTIGGVSDTFSVTTLDDTVPDTFTFIDQTGVARSSTITSNEITVSGITAAVPISITGGTYSINGGGYTSNPGTVVNGDKVTVRMTSSNSNSTTTNATLTIGGVSDIFSVTTRSNTTPDAFIFTDRTGVPLKTVITSNTITVSGIAAATSPISITGGTYSINGGRYKSASGTVSNGNTVTVRQTSSVSYSTTTDATLTIGGISDTFSVTTLDDTRPDAFTFTERTGVPLNKTITSNAITVSGITAAVPISINGGKYSINGGAYTSDPGTVNNGDTVTVQLTSSGSYLTTTSATLTIGGVSNTFIVITQAAPENDFNGDGISDILWRNTSTGEVTLWFMNADGATSNTKTLLTDLSWTVVATGDVNGDGICDIFWRNASTGQVTLWLMNADGTSSGSKALLTDPSWTVACTGDFNLDGRTDILWNNDANDRVILWLMNADGSSSGNHTLKKKTNWRVVGIGDFNGDGVSDILRRKDNGKVFLWFMNSDGTLSDKEKLLRDSDLTVAGTGYFSGDGICDILWRNDSTGEVTLWVMNADGTHSESTSLQIDPSVTVAGTGDFNGDGISDILWRNASTGEVTLWFMSNDGTLSSSKVLLTDPNVTVVPLK